MAPQNHASKFCFTSVKSSSSFHLTQHSDDGYLGSLTFFQIRNTLYVMLPLGVGIHGPEPDDSRTKLSGLARVWDQNGSKLLHHLNNLT